MTAARKGRGTPTRPPSPGPGRTAARTASGTDSEVFPAPAGLRDAGRALWDALTGDVAEGWELDARDLSQLEAAARAADRVAALEALADRDGLMVDGSKGQARLHPAVAEARMQRQLCAQLVARVELAPPAEKTGHLSGRQRDQLREARAARWPRSA